MKEIRRMGTFAETVQEPGFVELASATYISEKGFLQTVREYAGVKGWLIYHTHNSQRSERGFPDLVLVRGDKLLFLELKSEKGRVSPAQSHWIDCLHDAGQLAMVFRPHDWDTLVAILD